MHTFKAELSPSIGRALVVRTMIGIPLSNLETGDSPFREQASLGRPYAGGLERMVYCELPPYTLAFSVIS
jgi:hypothetical protein